MLLWLTQWLAHVTLLSTKAQSGAGSLDQGSEVVNCDTDLLRKAFFKMAGHLVRQIMGDSLR